MENLIIPDKINVGYQHREDTYSKKLGYITYKDSKGKLKKEVSWKGWSEKKMGYDEFDNVPLEGFVLNKDVGGVRESWSSWNPRMEKVRVFDPRGFEIEIDIPNMLFILQECNSMKGKGLEGEFVYGWQGQQLRLIPTSCQEYQASLGFTKMQGNKVNKDDLKEGRTYKDKNNQKLVYCGKHYLMGNSTWGVSPAAISEKYVFYNETYLERKEKPESHGFDFKSDLKTIAEEISEETHSKYGAIITVLQTFAGYDGKIDRYVETGIKRPQELYRHYGSRGAKFEDAAKVTTADFDVDKKYTKGDRVTVKVDLVGYLKIDKDQYQRVTFERTVEITKYNSPYNGVHRVDWKEIGFIPKSTAVYEFYNGKLRKRNMLKADRDKALPEKVYTWSELIDTGIVSINLIVKGKAEKL